MLEHAESPGREIASSSGATSRARDLTATHNLLTLHSHWIANPPDRGGPPFHWKEREFVAGLVVQPSRAPSVEFREVRRRVAVARVETPVQSERQ